MRSSSPPPFPNDLRVDPRKITAYILAKAEKAPPFLSVGFSGQIPAILDAALKQHVWTAHSVSVRRATIGPNWNYVFEGPLEGPTGTLRKVRSVWTVAPGATFARLVTAFKVG